MPDPIRVIVRLRDGRVLRGYTPAFDPKDRSIWCSPAPNSPAGTMIPFSRIKIVILEPAEGDPAPELPNITAADPSCRIRIQFKDGEDMVGSQKVRIPGVGYWLEPSDARGFEARAFVPEDVPQMVEMVDSGGMAAGSALPDKGWTIGAETQPERIPDFAPDEGETYEIARMRESESPTPQALALSERPTEAPPADKTDPSMGVRDDDTPTSKPAARVRGPVKPPSAQKTPMPSRPPRPVKTPSPNRPPPPSKTPGVVRTPGSAREKTDSEAAMDPATPVSKTPSVPTQAMPAVGKPKTGPTGKAHVADISTTQPDVPAPSLEDLELEK